MVVFSVVSIRYRSINTSALEMITIVVMICSDNQIFDPVRSIVLDDDISVDGDFHQLKQLYSKIIGVFCMGETVC